MGLLAEHLLQQPHISATRGSGRSKMSGTTGA